MGLFFWISGRMFAEMLGRRSPAEFVRRKLLHLGLPTLLYTFLLAPLTWMGFSCRWAAPPEILEKYPRCEVAYVVPCSTARL
jgi:hypothetical protein